LQGTAQWQRIFLSRKQATPARLPSFIAEIEAASTAAHTANGWNYRPPEYAAPAYGAYGDSWRGLAAVHWSTFHLNLSRVLSLNPPSTTPNTSHI